MLAVTSWNACLRGAGSDDVVLFGPDAAHLHSNVASSLKPLLPDADRTKLAALLATGRPCYGRKAVVHFTRLLLL